MRRLRRLVLPLCTVLALGSAVRADAQSSVLHEFLPPDPNEDLSLAATTIDGELPAALETPSGVVTAPDPARPPDADTTYGGTTTDDGPDSTYEPDRDTRQPQIERYDDPFSPSTAPFKRLRAYDSVGPDYTLRVADRPISLLSVGGTVDPGDDPFYGDLSVELVPDEQVRIPTVGPGARVIKMHVNPPSTVTLLEDGAENWFVRGVERKRVRLVMELAIPRATFGSEFLDVGWDQLERHVPPFARHGAEAARVFEAIGVSRAMRPREALGKLVTYFRGFASSDDPPRSHGDIYLDLALSKKGVCRHRAFAFLITALELGLPARMVVNEAHAWVEVFDGTLWHRIDLGGAALDIDQSLDPSRPAHQAPEDPFSWPEDAQQSSGQALADRDRKEGGDDAPKDGSDGQGGSGQGASGQGAADGQGASGAGDANGSSAPGPVPPDTAPANPTLPPSRLEVELVDRTVRRGERLRLKGRVVASQTCRGVRVDVLVRSDEAPNGRAIGSLSTGDDGTFDGAVVVPRDLAAGDHDLFVSTRGDQRCGAGRSE